MKLGQALIAARQKHQWSQAEAAEQIGVDAATISRWESGRVIPSAYNMRRIATAYGTTFPEWEYTQQEQATISLSQEEMPELVIFSEANFAMRLLSLAFVSCPYQQRAQLLRQALEEYDAMTKDDNEMQITRRNALMGLATLPLAVLGLQGTSMRKPAPHLIEETLNQCEAGILACEQLGKGKSEEIRTAFSSLSAYVSILKTVVDESSLHRKRAASLASQCYYWLGKLSPHILSPGIEKSYFSQAIVYAQESGDFEQQVMTLRLLAWAYLEDKQPKIALTTIQQAQSIIETQGHAPIDLSIKSSIYSTLGALQAKNHIAVDEKVLTRSSNLMEQAQKQSNGTLKYRYDLRLMSEGLTNYYQGKYEHALAAYEQILDPVSMTIKAEVPIRTQIEWLYVYTMASLKSSKRDMDKILPFWKAGTQRAIDLQSEQRFDEMSLAYEVMEGIWPNEARVKELRDLVVHW